MNELFNRQCQVQMGAILVSGLRVQFKIEKKAHKIPAKADISVWNLSRHTRAAMTALPVPLILQAGYGARLQQLFNGDVAQSGISVVRNGPDFLTTFKVGDGLRCFQTERCQIPVPQNANIKDVATQLLGMLKGVDAKKAIAQITSGEIAMDGPFQQLVGGSAVSGMSIEEIDRILKPTGKKVVITDGVVEIMPLGDSPLTAAEFPQDLIPDLEPTTGLIGSPEAVKDKFTKLRCLLRPEIKPGRKFRVVWSKHPEGLFLRAENVTHTGDTRGQEWYTDVEAKAL